MPSKPEIEKHRALHAVRTQFDAPTALLATLEAQMSREDQTRFERFTRGFEIEDWFKWTFAVMPWIKLIHGLEQQQFPERSKESYQVPDFLLLVETSRLETQPLLVEVKRVTNPKTTLKVQADQAELCEQYAASLRMPLVYAVYWEMFSAWTLNTPDTFRRATSTRNLPVAAAFESDCGLILGDISYLVPPSLVRVSRYSRQGEADDSSGHRKYGRRVFDAVSLGDRRVEMNEMESAAVDSILTMTQLDRRRHDDGQTDLTEKPDNCYVLKLSSWINRHLAIFGVQPSEVYATGSVHVITGLMEKLACPVLRSFPGVRSAQVQALARMFLTADEEHAAPPDEDDAGQPSG